MATIKLTRFEVRGKLPFPFDMLRYNQAWPAAETDALAAAGTHNPDHVQVIAVDVIMLGHEGPTTDRWRSQGWTVQHSSIERIKRLAP